VAVFKPQEFVEKQVRWIRETVRGKAIVALSGGVDSTVAAVLAERAIGSELLGIHVDTGLMRKGESEKLRAVFQRLGLHFRIVNASERFLKAIEGVADPEEKRRIIGAEFIRVFDEEAKSFGAEYLVQGTIAPDWIESGDTARDRIKSHHNVGGLPSTLQLRLVEPLRDLYKDEVREIARYLGVETSERQPFPGPGLAIRIAGEVNQERLETVREACAIVEEEIEKAYASSIITELPWQYFAVLLPIRSVGVQGDVRAYGYTIVVRAVRSKDAMTARFSDLPRELLEQISTRITNRLSSKVTRVLFDITNKPPATIEWE